MRGWIGCIALAACIMLGGTAMARQPAGFAGTAFGTPLTALPSFMTLKKNGDVTYAVNLKERYRLDGQAPVVVYGFANGKLFAAYVRLNGLIGRDAMAKRLGAQFGQPTVTRSGSVTVLRWRTHGMKIKLKSDAATGSLKIGYYSLGNPGVAAKLLDLDSVDIDALVRHYQKDKATRDIPMPSAPAPRKYGPYDKDLERPMQRLP